MLPSSLTGLLAGLRCLLPGDINSSPCGHQGGSHHGSCLPSKGGSKGKSERECARLKSQSSCDLISNVTSHPFCCAWLVMSESLILAQRDPGYKKTMTSVFLALSHSEGGHLPCCELHNGEAHETRDQCLHLLKGMGIHEGSNPRM